MSRTGIVAQIAAWRRGHRGTMAPNPATVAVPASVTFPTSPLTSQVFIALGADLGQPSSTWQWTDITQWVRFADGISTSQGRPDEAGTVRPSTGAMTLDNRDGRFSRRNPTGPYYGSLGFNTPIWATIDAGSGVNTRLAQFVNEWPTRWDISGNDATAPIVCAGILRRLTQAGRPRSALRRAITAGETPTVYWPMDEGNTATRAASGLAGGASTPVPTGTVKFGAAPLGASGASAGLDFSAGGGCTLSLPTGQVVTPAPGGWEFEFVVAFDTLPTVPTNGLALIAHAVSGLSAKYMGVGLTQNPTDGTLRFVVYQGDDGSQSFSLTSTEFPAVVRAQTYHIRLVAFVFLGTELRFQPYVDGVQGSAQGFTETVEFPDTIVLNPPLSYANNFVDSVANSAFIASVAFWPFQRTSPVTYAAGDAYSGETAVARVVRICGESGIPLVCSASTAASPTMGPQAIATEVDILRDAEKTDGGVLYETNWGLGYQSLSDRTNAPVALALDFHAGHIADPPEPADDDQRLRNRWTVNRTNGGEAVAELTSGPLGTGAAGPGLYDGSETVSVDSDARLPDQAGWRLHRDTVDEDRWPSVALRLHATPTLIDTWAALPFGARTTIANPPAQVAPDTIDTVIEGWSERWDTVSWDVKLSTSPASVYRTGTLATDTGDVGTSVLILVPDTLTLATAVNTTDVTWLVTSSPLWTVAAESFPRFIWWEGEIVQLTACAGGSAPQTWTVTRSVNGVVKSHLANSTGHVYRPGVLALA